MAAEPQHVIVYHEAKTFAGWPANGGLWTWDDGQESLVAFVTGEQFFRKGHNLKPPYTNQLARSVDGGNTWKLVEGQGFFQPTDKLLPLEKPINFANPNLALRFVSDGFHAGSPNGAGVCVSTDRGNTWQSLAMPELPKLESVTSRTDYFVKNAEECFIFGSSRLQGVVGDRVWCGLLRQGGQTFEFRGWINGPSQPNRSLMPSTVEVKPGEFVTTLRMRELVKDVNWIEAFRSTDTGKSWQSVGKVADTGTGNGNPPALLKLKDGRLACAYGDRTRRKMFLRFWNASGWEAEQVLRDDYQPDAMLDVDLGYPRMFQRRDGAIVVVYYWATKQHPTEHLAASILKGS